MKLFRTINIIGALCLLIVSCGEDRTYEYEEKTQGNHWMQTLMQEWYLWGDSLQDLDWRQYFAAPSAFVSRLTAQSKANDKWSYCTIDTVLTDNYTIGQFDHIQSYGIDFSLMTDPTGATTKQYARVLTVYPNSPAERCGLQRGDFIAQIGEQKMTRTIMSRLVNGMARTLVVNRLGADMVEEQYYWASVDTLYMEAAEKVDVPTVWQSCMIADDVAYIMLTDLNDYSIIKSRLQALLQHNPSDIIVDLRLCNQGTVECAVGLAEAISSAEGTLLQTVWNSQKSQLNEQFDISGASTANLFFITSSYTRGAAEWLIYGLKALQSDEMKVVGQTTAGQTVMLKALPTQYQYTVYPAVAFVCNGDGNHSYTTGISPDDEINEFDYAWLYPYGDENETIVDYILNHY